MHVTCVPKAYQCSDSDACNIIYANVYAVAGRGLGTLLCSLDEVGRMKNFTIHANLSNTVYYM